MSILTFACDPLEVIPIALPTSDSHVKAQSMRLI
jgi:hypothetical protein